MARRKPVKTETVDEDDTLRLAHLIRSIRKRMGYRWAFALVRRAFAFNGDFIKPIEEE